jgi:hypothetical protein
MRSGLWSGELDTKRIVEDLNSLNLQYLMLAREYANVKPLEATWVLGLSAGELQELVGYSITDINQLASCGRSLMRLPVPKKDLGDYVPLDIKVGLLEGDRHGETAE